MDTSGEPAATSGWAARRLRARSALAAALGAAVAAGALAGGTGAAARAADGDGVCTVTIELPATAESGRPISMRVLEDASCSGADGLAPLRVQDLVSSPLRLGYAGIAFEHAPGTGDASYSGIAPNPGVWTPRVLTGSTSPGYEVVLSTMTTTPQVAVDPLVRPARAVWVDDSLRITWPRVITFGEPGNDQSWSVYVDGQRVFVDESAQPGPYGAVEVRRSATAAPAMVEVVGDSILDSHPVPGDTHTTIFRQLVVRQTITPRTGRVSAAALLDRLPSATEGRTTSFSRSKFRTWLDADHDGEDTRAEVLESESVTTPRVDRRGVVTAGRWISRYDGKSSTRPSATTVDQLVPLAEAWRSGAAAWTATRRAAFANDLGFGPTLAAVSKTAARARNGRAVTGWLPSARADRCAYVRDWIAVKTRWGLSVDAAEKNALASDLTLFCTDLSVTKPSKPTKLQVKALVDRPRH